MGGSCAGRAVQARGHRLPVTHHKLLAALPTAGPESATCMLRPWRPAALAMARLMADIGCWPPWPSATRAIGRVLHRSMLLVVQRVHESPWRPACLRRPAAVFRRSLHLAAETAAGSDSSHGAHVPWLSRARRGHGHPCRGHGHPCRGHGHPCRGQAGHAQGTCSSHQAKEALSPVTGKAQACGPHGGAAAAWPRCRLAVLPTHPPRRDRRPWQPRDASGTEAPLAAPAMLHATRGTLA